MTCVLGEVERNQILWFPLIYPMNSLLIIFVFNIIICCTWSICPRAVEQATQATTRENLSFGYPTKRVSNQSLWLNRLDRKLNVFARSMSRDDSSQKADNKVADDTAWLGRLVWAFIFTNHLRQVFSVVSFICNHDTYKKTRCEIWLSWNLITQTEF